MSYTIEPKCLGAALLATGPVLTQLVGTKFAWWAGLIFMVAGPILLSMRRRNHNRKD